MAVLPMAVLRGAADAAPAPVDGPSIEAKARKGPSEPSGRPASVGAMRSGRISCGEVITRNTTLTADVGPCPGNGIIVGADNIILNLNGHTIFGTAGPGDGNAAGVRLPDRSNVTVTGHPGDSGKTGVVTGFDAGVVINRGSSNTVNNLVVQDNIGPDDANATLGDGLVIFNSAQNRVVNNSFIGNGIYDGIGVLGRGADDNLLQGNRVERTIGSVEGSASGTGIGIIVNNFLDLADRGYSVYRNRMVSNSVLNNFGSGISNISNVGGEVIGNVVEDNGLTQFASFLLRSPFHGIGVQASRDADPMTRVVVRGNRANHNGIAGIVVESGSRQNVIEQNTAIDNGSFGILVLGTSNRIIANTTGNSEPNGAFDLYDDNAACDNNEWFGNTWTAYTYPGYESYGSYYPECTGNGGSGPRPGLEAAF